MTSDQTGAAAAAAATAKDEAAGLAHAAATSGQGLLHEVKDDAGEVVAEATSQVRDLADQARTGLAGQASEQQTRAAASLRSLGDELGRMADGSQQGGVATDLVRQAADRTGSLATWLDDREPGDVLQEVTDFARRRPGLFLALAAGAGVLAGRLTRGLKDAPSEGGATAVRERPVRTAPAPAADVAAATQEGVTGGPPDAALGGERGGQHREPGPARTGDGPAWPALPSEQDAWAASGQDTGPGPAQGDVPAAGDPQADVRRQDLP